MQIYASVQRIYTIVVTSTASHARRGRHLDRQGATQLRLHVARHVHVQHARKPFCATIFSRYAILDYKLSVHFHRCPLYGHNSIICRKYFHAQIQRSVLDIPQTVHLPHDRSLARSPTRHLQAQWVQKRGVRGGLAARLSARLTRRFATWLVTWLTAGLV